MDAIDVSFDQANEILERAHRLLAQKHAREAREAREAEEAAAKAATEPEGEIEGEPVEAAAPAGEAEESTSTAALAEPPMPDNFEAKEIGAEEIAENWLSRQLTLKANRLRRRFLRKRPRKQARLAHAEESEAASELSTEAADEASASDSVTQEPGNETEHPAEDDGQHKDIRMDRD